MELIFTIIVVVIAIIIALREMRKSALMKKYGDAALVGRLMRREIWEGQLEEWLVDSIGKPIQIDQKVLKSRTREVWKYNQRTRRIFGLRVILEDGVVVGWDQKH